MLINELEMNCSRFIVRNHYLGFTLSLETGGSVCVTSCREMDTDDQVS